MTYLGLVEHLRLGSIRLIAEHAVALSKPRLAAGVDHPRRCSDWSALPGKETTARQLGAQAADMGKLMPVYYVCFTGLIHVLSASLQSAGFTGLLHT